MSADCRFFLLFAARAMKAMIEVSFGLSFPYMISADTFDYAVLAGVSPVMVPVNGRRPLVTRHHGFLGVSRS